MLKIEKFLGFNSCEVVDLIGLAGGFCLMWMKDLGLRVMNKNDRVLSVVMEDNKG